jgi:riboflavin kinase/FMN adenylyltransferase
MQVHRDIQQLPSFRHAVVTIGTFDGVHLGHRQVIQRLKEAAAAVAGETVIITFHPHPRKIVSSAILGIRLINTLEEKISLLAALEIDHLVIVPFTEAFANQPAQDYLEHFLIERFHPHMIIIGYDHRFGRDRMGDYRLLEKYAPQYDYRLKEIPKHILENISISSTNIREAILHSDIQTANKLLCYPFFFSGTVVDGDKLGRKLGYPTANLRIEDPEKLVPGNGIYAVNAQLRGEPNIMKGMMSIGFRPTVDGKKRVIEVNLFDFDREIYGEELKVICQKYLREEVKFDSLDELIVQIGKDKEDSLRLLR